MIVKAILDGVYKPTYNWGALHCIHIYIYCIYIERDIFYISRWYIHGRRALAPVSGGGAKPLDFPRQIMNSSPRKRVVISTGFNHKKMVTSWDLSQKMARTVCLIRRM